MEDITAVPLPPQPMIPTLTAELALEPKAMEGETTVTADMAAALLRKVLLFMVCIFLFYNGTIIMKIF
jgi:hypothetical protein